MSKVIDKGIPIAIALVIGFLVLRYYGCSPGSPPAKFFVRNSSVGAGKVIIVQNSSSKYLDGVTATVVARDGKQYVKGLAERLAPGQSVEVGWMELGTILRQGDRIEVRASGYPLALSALVP